MPASNYSVGRQTPGEGRYEFLLLRREQDLPDDSGLCLFHRSLSVRRLRWDGRTGFELCFTVIPQLYGIQRSLRELGIVLWWFPRQRKRLFRWLHGKRLGKRILIG